VKKQENVTNHKQGRNQLIEIDPAITEMIKIENIKIKTNWKMLKEKCSRCLGVTKGNKEM
jgi:hypothetical protein